MWLVRWLRKIVDQWEGNLKPSSVMALRNLKQLISLTLYSDFLCLALYLDTPSSTNSSWETSVDLNYYILLTS
jgi:hypothetical protein